MTKIRISEFWPGATDRRTGFSNHRAGDFPASREACCNLACNRDAMALRCLIVDDNAGFLRSARLLLEREGISVVAVASTGDEALRQAQELKPDVVLLDVDLGTESGFEVAGRLHGQQGGTSPSDVILISIHAEDDLADLIAASPAVGFISKSLLSARAICDLLDPDADGQRPSTEPRGT